jgi:hypothetical protein
MKGYGPSGSNYNGPHEHGGWVSEPSMMIGLRSGRFVGTIAENGPERVLPSGMGGSRSGISLGDMHFHIDGSSVNNPDDLIPVLEQHVPRILLASLNAAKQSRVA